MPASNAEMVLEALKTLLETVPDAVVERNSVLPEKVPDGGLIILRMRSRSRSTSRKATRRRVTLRSTPRSSRSALPSRPIRISAASPSV
jgi:hypothetical protein